MLKKRFSISHCFRFPSICVLCNQFHRDQTAVCIDCINLLTPLGHQCSQCAYPLPDSDFKICGYCIKQRPHYDKAYIAYPFEEPLRRLLHQFKYENGLYLTSFLCHLMVNSIQNLSADCLIPVPMHPKRLRERGYNHALVLAKALAKKIKCRYDYSCCQKTVNTPTQASLNGKQRQKNLQKAFKASSVPYQHVILVDDLLTTGATANELAYTLKKAGVQKVDLWCCARTVFKQE